MENLTPREIVAQLDKYIVGQEAAKRAVAIALRNRYRRQQLPPDLRRDILPKNILMIGPTGVGKTEIARRVAQLVDAPFVKVEATKFTEAGYVGRDVESIIFDLVEVAIDLEHDRHLAQVQDKAERLAKERLVSYLYKQLNGSRPGHRRARIRRQSSRREVGSAASRSEDAAVPLYERAHLRDLLEKSQLDDTMVEIELTGDAVGYDGYVEPPPGYDDGYEWYGPPYRQPSKRIRRVSVKEARRLLTREEANKLVDFDEVIDAALDRVEQSGVVFIDELDKIAGPRVEVGADISGEGVQRDLLPIVEGSVVMTRYGPVKTDHILFIGAGAFYQSKPSDLIPELQGRFPIRVELSPLGRDEFRRILTETDTSLVKQYQALLQTEGVDLRFTDDAIDAIADVACRVNETTENIGARRLQTVLERVLEDISFDAPIYAGRTVTIDAAYVHERMRPILVNDDLTRYIL
ncbi:MAG: ATP-dependent protease ATPase subunit HslU [Chloroflexi bacterium]|nr:ATP-dependent protease ATPase subunit HslU [Chloroflexota bacterium]